MSTDDLITRLAATAPRRSPPIWSTLAVAALAAVLAALALVLWRWGARPDLAQAAVTAGFWIKALYALALAGAGALGFDRLGRPGERPRAGAILAGCTILAVVLAAAVEFASTPVPQWTGMLLGVSWKSCSIRIAAVSLPGLLVAFLAMRGLAPTRPRLAGAAAGLMAGGLGAAAYSLSCGETSMAFLASWYSLGVLVCALIGALAGARLLRW